MHSQFQQRAVGIAVGIFLVALLLEVVLQGADGLGVVALEAADDVGDILRSLGRIFAVHVGLVSGDRKEGCRRRENEMVGLLGREEFEWIVVCRFLWADQNGLAQKLGAGASSRDRSRALVSVDVITGDHVIDLNRES